MTPETFCLQHLGGADALRMIICSVPSCKVVCIPNFDMFDMKLCRGINACCTEDMSSIYSPTVKALHKNRTGQQQMCSYIEMF